MRKYLKIVLALTILVVIAISIYLAISKVRKIEEPKDTSQKVSNTPKSTGPSDEKPTTEEIRRNDTSSEDIGNPDAGVLPWELSDFPHHFVYSGTVKIKEKSGGVHIILKTPKGITLKRDTYFIENYPNNDYALHMFNTDYYDECLNTIKDASEPKKYFGGTLWVYKNYPYKDDDYCLVNISPGAKTLIIEPKVGLGLKAVQVPIYIDEGRMTEAVITLEKGKSISGQVVDTLGNPVSNKTVKIKERIYLSNVVKRYDEHYFNAVKDYWDVCYEIETDAEGKLELRDCLGDGPIRILYSSNEITAYPGGEPVRIVVNPQR
ncbi:MAG: hypothetical protein A2W23_04595 [Planctomycetes bacterium RBG_16_43_13]|nr:MAG: hypothetical protein A2W23_04595 [Planctomycetes bacterium RBG_16_43_13]